MNISDSNIRVPQIMTEISVANKENSKNDTE
jgi:hypothetical protein